MPYLERQGWIVDVVSGQEGGDTLEFSESDADRAWVAKRARKIALFRTASAPAFALLGIRHAAVSGSMAWAGAGVREIRRRLAAERYDAALATAPPIVGPIALRLAQRGTRVPFVVELRDLFAGNPAYDRRGGLLGATERWLVGPAAAIVVSTPEAVADFRVRHPHFADRIREIANGFEPELLGLRTERPPPGAVTTILHSGTLTPSRPLTPLLDVLAQPQHRGRFRLVLHGPISRKSLIELSRACGEVDAAIVPPSGWREAVERIRAADVALVTQSRSAGDETAVAAKVYEYLALGKPVLALTHGGATEALLRRLGADALCARLDRPSSIARAVDRIAAGPLPEPIPKARLASYSRSTQAAQLADLLEGVAQRTHQP
jgi:glycosyltransferase involved in cell wall biosynthesis